MNSGQRIRALIVDDHPLIREGIAALLAREPAIELVGEAGDGARGVAQFEALRPDVVLMDLQMPGGSGIDAIGAILALDPAARVIVLTTFAGDVRARRALDAGARAYLIKGRVRTDLVAAIHSVMAGARPVDPDVVQEMRRHAVDDALTEREAQVLRLVARGLANREIGERLAIGEGTVKNHLKRILSKLGASDRTHAVVIGMERGVLEHL